MSLTPVTVAVTGAAGQIGYSLLFRIAHGDLLGRERPVSYTHLDVYKRQNEETINAELLGVQGSPADLGGYYWPKPELVSGA